MFCVPCAAMLHDLCDDPTPIDGESNVRCCCWTENPVLDAHNDGEIRPGDNGSGIRSTLGSKLLGALNGGEFDTSRSRTPKDGEELRDVLSTGRKRAAQAKPISADGAVCEWAGLKNAGGGVQPIIGCSGNLLTQERGKYARHHGPDKNVLNNSPENLHLICPTCHNRWHTLNDPYYGDGTGASRPPAGRTWTPREDFVLHDGVTKATAVEILQNEVFWKTKKIDRKVESDDTADGLTDE